MAPPLQDQFIDDDDEEEVCPLCVEELDLTDKNFKPCPCGYQICQFCYNNIKTTMNGLCPACRRPYDDKSIQYKVVSPEEMAQHRLNTAQQQKRRLAARQKEAQKREADHLSRKHLSGLRVRQKNLVYVTGLRPKATGDKLVEALRGREYFGQYGEILKIVVARQKDAPITQTPIIGIYITFAKREDAESCIECVDMSRQEDGSRLRAQYGTTKYCSAYLRGETCTNKNCMFLHEAGDDNESFTRQDLSNLNAISTQEPAAGIMTSDSPQPQAPPQQVQPVAAAIQDVDLAVHSPIDHDGPALPAHASWADQARRESRTTNASAESPQVVSTVPVPSKKLATKTAAESSEIKTPAAKARTKPNKKAKKIKYPYFEDLPKKAFDPNFSFCFNYPVSFSEKDKWIVEHMPPLFDPNEGTRRRLIKEREVEEFQRQQAEIDAEAEGDSSEPLMSAPLELEELHEQGPGGSSQLGGEPEELPERTFGQQSFLQQQVIGSSSLGDQGFNDEFSGLGTNRSGSQQQRMQQQLLLQQLSKGSGPAAFSNQTSGHGRQPSRYFLNEAMGTVSKNQAKQMSQAQFAPGIAHNSVLGSQFNYSNVQGPPPGLKTSGTPPITNSMFAQGHGFAPSQGHGGRDNEKMWEAQRGRGNAGGPDSGKLLLQALDQDMTQENIAIPGLGSLYPDPTQRMQLQIEHRSTPIVPPGLPIPLQCSSSNIQFVSPQISSPLVVPRFQSPASLELQDKSITFEDEELRTVSINEGLGEGKAHKSAKQSTVESTKSSAQFNKPVALSSTSTKTSKNLQTGVDHASSSQIAHDASVSLVPDSQASLEDPAFSQSDETPTMAAADASGPPPPADGVATYANSLGRKPAAAALTLNTSTSFSIEASDAILASRTSRPPSTAPSMISRPETPLAEVLNTPIKRIAQPRTLRITDNPRTAPSAFPSDLPSTSVQAGSKVSSRRPSLSSTAQPSTPLSEMADMSSLPSASNDISRANSPPPLAGKKRGEKKPKKAKRVTTEPDVLETEVQKLAEEQSPIMGRKKKSKKLDAVPTMIKKKDSKATKPASSPAKLVSESIVISGVEEPAVDNVNPVSFVKPAHLPESASPQIKTKRFTDSLFAAIGPELEVLINSALGKPISMTAHLKNIDHQHGQNIRPFSHPNDLAAFFASRDPFVLSPADHANRINGHAIRRSAEDGRISSRIIETPRGTRLRCLSEQEEDQLLDLEDKICSMLGTSFWGGGSLEYALAGMPGYDQKQKQHAISTLGKLFPAENSSSEALRDDAVQAVGSTEDPARLINQFIFNQETEGITPMVPFAGEKAHIHRHHEEHISAPVLQPSTATQSHHQHQQQADSSSRVAGAAARAAAAMGSTREVIEQVMGPAGTVDEAERRWQEEKRYVDGLERRFNGMVKRNRKVLSGAAAGL